VIHTMTMQLADSRLPSDVDSSVPPTRTLFITSLRPFGRLCYYLSTDTK